jgi:hypothetical protein
VKIYIVWLEDVAEENMFVGWASTKQKAEQLIEKAVKKLKNKDSMPNDLDKNWFVITKINEEQIDEGLLEY